MEESSLLHSPYIINSIDDALELLQKALNDDLTHYDVKINNLEQFSMHLTGEQFHQTITTSVMKGFIDLQSAIYRSYALIKYDETNILRLTKDEKRSLEIEVKVIEGSSGFDIDWQQLFEKFIKETVGKMNSKHVLIAVLVTIVTLSGVYTHSQYIENQTQVRLAEIAQENNIADKQERLATIALLKDESNKDTKKILNEAESLVPKTTRIIEEANIASHSLLKSAQAAEKIDLNGVSLSGEAANELTKSTPAKWHDVRLDGIYHIINVDSSHASKRRVRIRNVDTQQEIVAILENDTLDEQYLNIIKDAEWSYDQIFLKMKAKEFNGKYKEARITKAALIN